MNESLSLIRADFDRLARFDTDAWGHNSHYHSFLLRQLPAHCGSVLEVGCGTGSLARLLAARSDHVTALDLSPEMIGIARERSTTWPNISYEVADVMSTELPRERFDAILSVATLHHLPPAAALEKFREALKPGGVIALLDLFQGSGWQDIALSIPAMWLSAILRLLKNGQLRESPAVRAAWNEHGRHDVYPTLAEVREICANVLPGAQVRRHLFWRYSLVWRKTPPQRIL